MSTLTKLIQSGSIKNILSLTAYCYNITDIQAVDATYGKTWMFFPDEDGNAQIIQLSTNGARSPFAMSHDDPDSKISFWLYNK